jgi:hypothetical protein
VVSNLFWCRRNAVPTLPGTDRLPAVVFVHGAGGIGFNYGMWAGELPEADIVGRPRPNLPVVHLLVLVGIKRRLSKDSIHLWQILHAHNQIGQFGAFNVATHRGLGSSLRLFGMSTSIVTLIHLCEISSIPVCRISTMRKPHIVIKPSFCVLLPKRRSSERER